VARDDQKATGARGDGPALTSSNPVETRARHGYRRASFALGPHASWGYASTMAIWTFEDGSVVRSGGRVTGRGRAAVTLRRRIAERSPVHALPLPSAPVALDVSSDFLLDCLCSEVRFATMTKFATEYERRDDDAPPALHERLAQARRARESLAR
jgi:hypothetical protein